MPLRALEILDSEPETGFAVHAARQKQLSASGLHVESDSFGPETDGEYDGGDTQPVRQYTAAERAITSMVKMNGSTSRGVLTKLGESYQQAAKDLESCGVLVAHPDDAGLLIWGLNEASGPSSSCGRAGLFTGSRCLYLLQIEKRRVQRSTPTLQCSHCSMFNILPMTS